MVPMPDKATVCGLPSASSVIDKVPVASPFSSGTNSTWIWQLPLTGRLAGQLLVSVNAPVVAIFEMFTGTVPVLVKVAV